jgi:hypothetical protein
MKLLDGPSQPVAPLLRLFGEQGEVVLHLDHAERIPLPLAEMRLWGWSRCRAGIYPSPPLYQSNLLILLELGSRYISRSPGMLEA